MSESPPDFHILDDTLDALRGASAWYVGFSGGIDSTVLLHLLSRWRLAHRDAPPLSAIHINHGLQAAAAQWQSHCAGVCAQWNVPFIAVQVEVGDSASLEAAAREARYKVFESHLQADGVLFLGHHLDDQVETFFLRLMRGAGVEGLAGMPRSRALGRGSLQRPLLDIQRARLEQYAREQALPYIEDPSNRDTRLDRNFLRQEVLPLLATRWPAYRQTVTRSSDHLDSAAATLARALGVPPTTCNVMGDPGVKLADLGPALAPERAYRLRHWLLGRGLPLPDESALAEFLRQLECAADDAAPAMSCGGYHLQRYRDAVYLLPQSVAIPPAGSYTLGPQDSCPVPGVGVLQLQAATGRGLQLAPDEVLQLAWRAGGERCRLAGGTGSRSLKKLLQEWDIPPWWRARVPLVYLGDELLAIADLALAQSSRFRAAGHDGQPLWNIAWQRPESGPCD